MKTPEGLNDKQKDQYQEAWLDTLRTFIFGAKTILFFVFAALLYIPLEDDIKNLFKEKQEVKVTTNRSTEKDEDYDRVENGIHVQTGFVVAPGFDEVRANCTVCHSSKLVTQNRATREGWEQMIIWMQEKQGLWDLGDRKPIILDYLSTHYAPIKKGRRDNIDIAEVEWYILDLENTD